MEYEIFPSNHDIIQIRVDRNKEAPAEYRAKVKEIWDDMGKMFGFKGLTSSGNAIQDYLAAVGNVVGNLNANVVGGAGGAGAGYGVAGHLQLPHGYVIQNLGGG